LHGKTLNCHDIMSAGNIMKLQGLRNMDWTGSHVCTQWVKLEKNKTCLQEACYCKRIFIGWVNIIRKRFKVTAKILFSLIFIMQVTRYKILSLNFPYKCFHSVISILFYCPLTNCLIYISAQHLLISDAVRRRTSA
jgi:hypothetical protein